MAIRYYDDAIIAKIKKWLPDNSRLRVLKPDETNRLLELAASDSEDKNLKLPLLALSRSKDIELLSNIKQERSFNGLALASGADIGTIQLNIIPIKVEYQLDIYTKTYEEGDEYVRQFLFKLINNPVIYAEIPYNSDVFNKAGIKMQKGDTIRHIANLRVLNSVSDTSDISTHIFSGQFTRWTIQLELQDGFLFSIPYKNNWTFGGTGIELSEKITEPGIFEEVKVP